MRFFDTFWKRFDRRISFWRGFSAVFTLYYAVSAYIAGLHNKFFEFGANAVIAGCYLFSCAKAHSALRRRNRRRR